MAGKAGVVQALSCMHAQACKRAARLMGLHVGPPRQAAREICSADHPLTGRCLTGEWRCRAAGSSCQCPGLPARRAGIMGVAEQARDGRLRATNMDGHMHAATCAVTCAHNRAISQHAPRLTSSSREGETAPCTSCPAASWPSDRACKMSRIRRPTPARSGDHAWFKRSLLGWAGRSCGDCRPTLPHARRRSPRPLNTDKQRSAAAQGG